MDGPRSVHATSGAERRPSTIVFAHKGENWIRGSERCLLDLVGRLDPARFRSVVLCDSPVLADAATAVGADVVRLAPWKRGGIGPARSRLRLRPLLRARGAALVHANMPDVLCELAPLARELRVPVVAHLHLPYDAFGARHQALVRESEAIVGVAEHAVAPLRMLPGVADRVHVVANAVDVDRLARGDARGLREALGIPATAFVVASVGSLIARKAHDVTIRAVALARAGGRDVHLLLCGDGPDEPALRSLARALGVDGAVHLLGDRDDAGAVIRDAAQAFVTSAREEALPLGVLEAQALGLPVIASEIAGHAEALGVDGGGVLVAREDPAALAGAIVALADDPAARRRLGAAGRARAATAYAMDRYVAAFAALYDRLLDGAHAAPATPALASWPRELSVWLAATAGRRRARRRP